jgi:hypothetical protein
MVEATGINFTGCYLDELMPGDPDEPWMNDYRHSFDTKMPVLGRCTVQMKSGARYSYEFGMFPLRKGGSEIAQFIGREDYFDFSLVDMGSEPWLAQLPEHPNCRKCNERNFALT